MSSLSFFLAWFAAPAQVGAVMPSSAALADALTAEISPASAPVIELGPGTGAVTQALLRRGVPEDRLALVELTAKFARRLEARFPAAHVLNMDATRLRDVELFAGQPAGAVVSGLPLVLMPLWDVMAVLKSAFHHLAPDGGFYQFTYRFGPPIPRSILARLELDAVRIGGTFANVPPASVYRITRRR